MSALSLLCIVNLVVSCICICIRLHIYTPCTWADVVKIFSKVSTIVLLYSKLSSELAVENFTNAYNFIYFYVFVAA